MNSVRSYSWKKRFALIAFTALFCIALASGVVLSYAENNVVKAYADETTETVTVVDVSLTAVDGYTLQDGYWRDSIGDFAFVQGMSAADAVNRIGKVYVTYSDGTVKDFSVGSGATLTLASANTGDNSKNSETVLFNVVIKDGADTISAQCSLDFIQKRPYSLVLIDKVSTVGERLTTTTAFSDFKTLLNGKVNLRYTDGTQEPLTDTRFLTTDETLVPDSTEFGELMSASASQTYSKTISVYYSSSASTVIDENVSPFKWKVEDIQFVKISDIIGLSGSLANQTARADFNFNGLTFIAKFSNGRVGNYPAADFKDYCTVRYFIEGVEQKQGSRLTMQVDKIVIDWSIPSGGESNIAGSQTFEGREINIYQTIKNLPSISSLNPEYSPSGCSITLSSLDLDDNNPVSVEITGPGSPVYALVNGEYVITFDQGGEYTVKVVLTKGSTGDYIWKKTQGNPHTDDSDDYLLIYDIKVENAPINLQLTYAKADREYGDAEPDRSVKMSYKDGTVITDKLPQGVVTDNASSRDVPNYGLRYFGWGGYTETNPSLTAPKELGTYKVYAVTGKTALYQAGKSNIVSFEIVRRKISVSQMNNTAEFADKQFLVGDIVKLDDGNKKMLAYDDTAEEVLALSSTPSVIYHAGTYDINLALTSGKGSNYTLGSDSSLSFSFTVTAANLTFGINNFKNSFKYGETVPVTWSDFDTSNLKGWVTVNSAPTFYKVVNGVSTEVKTAQPWDIGDYKVVYDTSELPAPSTVGTSGQDYNLPSAEAYFTITAQTIGNVTLTAENKLWNDWGGENKADNWISRYGTALKSTLNNFKYGANTAPDGSEIVTVTIDGKRLTSATAIDAADCVLTNNQITLTQAGFYVVTISLNDNYVWDDGANYDVVYYGSIDKAVLDGLTVSAGGVYDGGAKTADVAFKVNGGSAGWHKDGVDSVLTISQVEGTRFVTSKKFTVATESVDNSVGRFTVTQAATYAATVAITYKDNYKWSDDAANAAKTLQYVISQADLLVSWAWDVNTQFDPHASAQKTPAPTVQAKNDDADSISITTELYENGVKINSVTTQGTFVIRVVAHSAKTSGDETYLNYVIPTDESGASKLYYEFTVAPLALAPVTLKNIAQVSGKAVTVPYMGSAYKFADYIANYGGANTNKIEWLTITVDMLPGNNPNITNVLLDGSSVTSYNVTVSPAANYKWDVSQGGVASEDEGMRFTFTVTQVAVQLSWSNTAKTYGATTVASAVVGNKFGTDDVTVAAASVVYKQNGVAVNPQNAGSYTVTATALSGEKSKNYKIDATADGSNITVNYIIYKQGVSVPAVTKVSATFDGNAKTATFTKNALLSASVSAVRPKEWFTSNPASDVAFTNHGATIDCANGTATLSNAGRYSATFTINDGANYCWQDELDAEKANFGKTDYSRAVLLGEIGLANITAPKLGELRAMERDDGRKTEFDSLFTNNGYNTQYGTDGSGTLTDARQDVNNDGTTNIGQYFVLLTAADAFNYKWVVEYDGADGTSFAGTQFIGGRDVYVATFTESNGAQVQLAYAITASQVKISYDIKDYVFGANAYGYYDGVSFSANTTLLNAEAFLILRDYEQYENLDGARMVDTDVKFYRIVGGKVEEAAIIESDLVNGLPWFAGDYVVKISVTFENAEKYQPWSDSYSFTINPLLVEVKWSGTDSATYNGQEQTRGATVINVPQKIENGNEAGPVLTVSKVTDVKWSNHAVAAYTVTIESVGDSDNYTIVGLASNSASFTVNTAEISVKADSVSAHVYGEAIPSDIAFNLVGGELFGGDTLAGIAKVAVLTAKTDGVAVTSKTAVGSYVVLPQLRNVEGNYSLDLNDDCIGEFNIVKRQITVTVQYDGGKTKATSVYGADPTNLMTVYSVSAEGCSQGLPSGVSAADVFKLSAAVTNTSPVGNYHINCALVDSVNYELVNASDFGDNGAIMYVVSNAAITGVEIHGYHGVYDAQSHSVLDSIKAFSVNAMQLKWYLSEDGANWNEDIYATTASGVAYVGSVGTTIRNVGESKSYYVKVVADNHEPYVYANAVEVKVTKAPLTVSVNMSIYFGEHGPLDYDGQGGKYQMTLADLRNADLTFKDGSVENGQSIYSVRGLYAADKDAFRADGYVGGTIAYSYGDVYGVGSPVDDYVLNVAVALTCGNYEFGAGEVNLLTVEQLPVSVRISDCRATFNQENPSLPVAVVATKQPSSYRGVSGTITVYDADVAQIVKISNPALDTKSYVGCTTNNAGTYDITITLTDNYVLEQNGYAQATYVIDKAVNRITSPNYSLFTGSEAYSANDGSAPQAWVYGDYGAAHLNGYNPNGAHKLQTLEMLFWGTQEVHLQIVLKGPHAACNGTAVGLTVSQTQDVRMSSFQGIFDMERGNGHLVAGEYAVTFTMAETTNYLEFRNVWKFTVGKQDVVIKPQDVNVTYGNDLNELSGTSVSEKYYPYVVNGLVSVKGDGVLDELASVVSFKFTSAYQAGKTNGSVKTEGYAVTATEVKDALGNALIVGDGKYETANYFVTFDSAKVIVKARPITVQIKDLSNRFDLIRWTGGTDYIEETRQNYVFKLVSGTFALCDLAEGKTVESGKDTDWQNQTVFVLSSQAFDSANGYATNNQGQYPVSLTQNKNVNGLNNYAVTVQMAEGYSSNFTVLPAQLNLAIDPMPYKDASCKNQYTTEINGALEYDGYVKYFKEQQNVLPSFARNLEDGVPGAMAYFAGSALDRILLDKAPKDVGSYYVEFIPDGGNYECSIAGHTYGISRRLIDTGSVITNADGLITGSNGYYFNGGTYVQKLTFSRIVDGEQINVNFSIDTTKGYNAATMGVDRSNELGENVFTFSARNAGAYVVTLTLADGEDSNAFKAGNYRFDADGKNSYTFTLSIEKPTLRIATVNTAVQYGASLDGSLFNGFSYVYSLHFGSTMRDDADGSVTSLINVEDSKGFYFKTKGYSGKLYTTDYVVSQSKWGETYELKFDVEKLNAYNFVVATDNVESLQIIARDVTVTVKGYFDGVTEASRKYAGQSYDHNAYLQSVLGNAAVKAKFFATAYGDDWTKPDDFSDNQTLSLFSLRMYSQARNVTKVNGALGGYNMAPSYTEERYNVTFVNTDGVAITSDVDDGNCPKYAILPKTLTIAVSSTGSEDTINSVGNTFVYPYGTSFESRDSQLIFRFYGLIAGEGDGQYQFGHTNNNITVNSYTIEGYTPWESGYNSEYSVKLNVTNNNDNYTVAFANDKLKVGQLTLTATSSEVKYNNGEIDGNNGLHGAELPVKLTYAYGSNSIALPDNASNVLNKATITYSTKSADANGAGKAPTKAGSYTATVTLDANGNYKFVASGNGDSDYVHTFQHKVTPLSIAFGWEKDSVDVDRNETNATSYYESLIDMVSFNNVNGSIMGSGGYSIAEGKLTITPEIQGRYEMTVNFNVNAARNYLWPDNTNGTYVTGFTVITTDKSVKLELTVNDITYGESFSYVEKLTTVHGAAIEGYSITYSFAAYNKTVTQDTNRVISAGEGSTITGYSTTFPSAAGWYVVRGYYAGTDQLGATSEYRLFQIKKVTVDKPVLSIVTEGDDKNDVYTGYRLKAGVEYSQLNVFISNYRESYDITSTGAMLYATNAGDYAVTFVLVNSANYEWQPNLKNDQGVTVATDANGAITSVTLVWTIASAQDNAINWDVNNVNVIYGENYSITAQAKYAPDSVAVYYVAKGSYANAEDVPDNAWSTQARTSAGGYYVKAVSEQTSNYNRAVAYKELQISKKQVEMIANGVMTYGQSFGDAVFTREIVGLVNGDSAAAITAVAGKTVKYLLAEEANPEQLSVGTYKIILGADSAGYVDGLTSGNYVIVPKQGELTVQPKQITVVIGTDSQSVYNDDVILTNSVNTKFADDLVEWDKANGADVLKVVLSTTAQKGSNIGLYPVTAQSYDNGNYNVTFENGIHTIAALQVRVVISAGGGEYGGSIAGAKVERIYTVNSAHNTDLDINVMQFTYRYTGKSNSNVEVNGSVCPTLAGTYIATVSGILDNSNYVLDLTTGDVSVPFVISKKTIDADALKIPSKSYTGSAIEPQIVDDVYNVNGAEIYRVVEHADFIERGTHTFMLRLLDFNNYKWQSVDIADKEVQFVITKAVNALVSNEPDAVPTITIKGWTYGYFNPDVNLPEAFVKYGQENILFTYSNERDGEYTTGIPASGNAGDYWVRVTVLETDNYERFDSEPVKFTIEKVALTAPSLVIDGTNSAYTGESLRATVVGFNSLTMDYSYAETAVRDGSNLQLTAVNAGKYEIKILLTQNANYRWADGTVCDEQGNAVLTWTVARKKIAKPQDSARKLVVNGSLLTYLPDGFDESIMGITDNQSGYGGEFTAHVYLLDTSNYEWDDGSVDTLDYVWNVVGAHTVFIAIICSLSAVVVALGVVAIVQYARYRKKKYTDVREEFGDEAFSPDKTKQTDSTDKEVDK